MSEDTLRETPVSKASEPRIKVGSDDWKAPPEGTSTELAPPGAFEPPVSGAKLDFGFGDARVHTFEAKGPLALVLAVVVLLAVAAIFTLVLVFAVGAGAALAAGTAVAAVLGFGVAKVSRLLSGGRRQELDERGRKS